jgi:hypothetical protein
VEMPKDSFVKGKIGCAKFDFPMRFLCLDKRADIDVLIGYDFVPTASEFDEKHFKKNFYIQGKKNVDFTYVGIMVIAHTSMNSKIGCAFNYLKARRLKNRPDIPKFQNGIRAEIEKGIDYDGVLDFSLSPKMKKKLRKKYEKNMSALTINIRSHIEEVSNKSYVENKIIEKKMRFNLGREREEKAKMKRLELLKNKIEENSAGSGQRERKDDDFIHAEFFFGGKLQICFYEAFGEI